MPQKEAHLSIQEVQVYNVRLEGGVYEGCQRQPLVHTVFTLIRDSILCKLEELHKCEVAQNGIRPKRLALFEQQPSDTECADTNGC